MRNLMKLIRDRRGASAIEYALVASLISVAGIVAFENLGNGVNTKFEQIEQKL